VRLYLINSPLVRADNLNFSKEGVRAVVKDVFLPWYNAYRFLIHHIAAHEQQSQRPFCFQPPEGLSAELNSIDRWILSALQILVREVRKEMKEYKLYNVVPKMIQFLEQLTNWYLRLNRPRMKGEQGLREASTSLQVLLEVMHKLNVLMSPHVPFLTEHMYQNMKLVFGEDSPLSQSSIHHLQIPTVNPDLLNEVIAEQMSTVVSIIETARQLRDLRQISLKSPVAALTIVSKNPRLLQEL
jgi:isoleucyl-tRNA synthetase